MMSWLNFNSYKSRLNICASCPKYEAPKCTVCGCFMPAKAALPMTDCPEGLWSKYIEVQSERPEWFEQESR